MRSKRARRTWAYCGLGASLYCFKEPENHQAAWVVLIRPQSWERHGLKPWIESAKTRLHHNVLAIALANKLAAVRGGL